MGRPLGPLSTDVQNVLMGARACAVRKAPLVRVGPGGDRNDERDITGDESRGKQRNSRRQGTCSATRPGVTGTTASGAPSRWTQAEHSGRKARPVTPAGTGSTWRPRDGPSDWPGSVCWLRSCGRRVASSGTRDPGCVNAGRVLGPAPRDSHASPVNNHLQLSGARLRPCSSRVDGDGPLPPGGDENSPPFRRSTTGWCRARRCTPAWCLHRRWSGRTARRRWAPARGPAERRPPRSDDVDGLDRCGDKPTAPRREVGGEHHVGTPLQHPSPLRHDLGPALLIPGGGVGQRRQIGSPKTRLPNGRRSAHAEQQTILGLYGLIRRAGPRHSRSGRTQRPTLGPASRVAALARCSGCATGVIRSLGWQSSTSHSAARTSRFSRCGIVVTYR